MSLAPSYIDQQFQSTVLDRVANRHQPDYEEAHEVNGAEEGSMGKLLGRRQQDI